MFSLIILLATAVCVFGQGTPVKWELLNGHAKEFAVFMPEKNVTILDKNIYLAKPAIVDEAAKSEIFVPGGGLAYVEGDFFAAQPAKKADVAHAKMRLIVWRQVGGAVLLMTFYEGDVTRIQKDLLATQNLKLQQEETTLGFAIKDYTGQLGGSSSVRVQHFLKDDRLYVLEAVTSSEDSRVAKGFFESVRLTGPNGIVAPNAPPGASKTTLPGLKENEVLFEDAQAIMSTEADRGPIILREPGVHFTEEMREVLNSNSFRVTFKFLMSASGKVTKVEILKGGAPLANRYLIETLSKTQFVPAVKNGKLVSVYWIHEIRFNTKYIFNPIQNERRVI